MLRCYPCPLKIPRPRKACQEKSEFDKEKTGALVPGAVLSPIPASELCVLIVFPVKAGLGIGRAWYRLVHAVPLFFAACAVPASSVPGGYPRQTGHSAGFGCQYSLLQWSRSFSAAEMEMQSIDGDLVRVASMEPQLFSRGN